METKRATRPSPQIYVPKGRRELLERQDMEEKVRKQVEDEARARKKEADRVSQMEEERHKKSKQDNHSQAASSSSSSFLPLQVNSRWAFDEVEKKDSTRSSSPPSFHSKLTYQAPTIDDSEFSTVIDDEKLASSCLVLSGFPAEMSDAARGRVLEGYHKAGGASQWIGSTVAILAFLNESAASRALSKHQSSSYKVEVMFTSNYSSGDYLAVARALHSQLRPDRDSRVANRLIGAALGIRLPSRTVGKGQSSLQPRVQNSLQNGEEEQSNDAWDS